jgi:hypothetical protein
LSSPTDLDLGKLLGIATTPTGGLTATSDFLHLGLDGSTVEVGDPLALSAADGPEQDPLIDINAQLFSHAGGTGGLNFGGAFLARLVESGSGAVASAAHIASNLLDAGEGDAGGSDCHCDGLLQPLVGNILDQADDVLT